MTNVLSTIPRTLSHDENTVTNPCDVTNYCSRYNKAKN